MGAYYRAIENMLNLSDKNSHILSCFNAPFNDVEGSFLINKDHYKLDVVEDDVDGDDAQIHEIEQIDEATQTNANARSRTTISLEPLKL